MLNIETKTSYMSGCEYVFCHRPCILVGDQVCCFLTPFRTFSSSNPFEVNEMHIGYSIQEIKYTAGYPEICNLPLTSRQ